MDNNYIQVWGGVGWGGGVQEALNNFFLQGVLEKLI